MQPVPKNHAAPLQNEKTLTHIFNAALAAVDPYNSVTNAAKLVHGKLIVADTRHELAAFNRIVVIGAGKATARMALAIESLLGKKISEGLIVVKDGHTAPLSIIEQVEAAHPVPDAAGVEGTQRILQLLHGADKKTFVICLLSGGASALLVAPSDGITLKDKQDATRLLLNAGATINELNAVRKHLSHIKGGRLAQAAFPAQLVTLILSDVIGDPLDVIASGPTAPDGSTFDDVFEVIEKYGLQRALPTSVMAHLQRGRDGLVQETLKRSAPCFDSTQNVIIGSNHLALEAAKRCATQLGYSTRIVSDALQGEARKVAHGFAQTAHNELAEMKAGERRCLLYGGETTVTVRGNGTGGRNQELALAFAIEIEELRGVSLLSAGTDGSDGPTDAAGGMVDGYTVAQAKSQGINVRSLLDNNDSYTFFQRHDAATNGHIHFKTGPTGTNVMDVQIVLLEK